MANEETRINTGLTILPSVKEALLKQAQIEDKSFSRLCEGLLEWALNELLQNKINSTTLKTDWKAVPQAEAPVGAQIKRGRKAS